MRKDEAKSILLKTIPCLYKDNEKICHHLQEGGGDCESCYEEALDTILNLVEKLQKEIEGKNAVIDTYKHTEKVLTEQIDEQQKEIEEYNQDLYNKLKYSIKQLEQDFISKDKIREKIKKYHEIAEDVKQKYKGVYAYRDDYLEALAKIEGYEELLEEN